MPQQPTSRSAGTILGDSSRETLSAERQKFLASVQKTIRSWGLEDDHGFADFVAEEVKKWEQDEEEEKSSRDTASWKSSGVSVLEVDSSGHSVHLENPLAFVRELHNFVLSFTVNDGNRKEGAVDV
eukprot:TRINITY_DN21698_c0_g1_i1.p2 TRINITY_DN21698_c0_g1~~TRINITY_DN21698_c0_g1_i1.p2  ORF type:complete len:137 (-),score=22.18 TRINITY_DN21698_c0_g1_i1:58-435(-)